MVSHSSTTKQLNDVEAKIKTLENRLMEVACRYKMAKVEIQAQNQERRDEPQASAIRDQELKELHLELQKKEDELFSAKQIAREALAKVEIMTKKLKRSKQTPNSRSIEANGVQ
jgi:hypothetical protein